METKKNNNALTIILIIFVIVFMISTAFFGIKLMNNTFDDKCPDCVKTCEKNNMEEEEKFILYYMQQLTYYEGTTGVFKMSEDSTYIEFGKNDENNKFVNLGYITKKNGEKITAGIIFFYGDKNDSYQMLILSKDLKLYLLNFSLDNLNFDENTKLVAEEYNDKLVKAFDFTYDVACDEDSKLEISDCMIGENKVIFTYDDKSKESITIWEEFQLVPFGMF